MILPIGGFSIQLTPKTIAIAIGVLVLVSFGVHYKMVLSQRDSAREKVAVLEKELRLERATYEASKQQWQKSLGKVEEAFAEAQRRRMSVEAQLAGMEEALKSQERIIRDRGRELERLRSDAIQSHDCCIAWQELIAALGWAEGDM